MDADSESTAFVRNSAPFSLRIAELEETQGLPGTKGQNVLAALREFMVCEKKDFYLCGLRRVKPG